MSTNNPANVSVPDLRFSTDNPYIDHILAGVIETCEKEVPGLISAYYLTGSYAYGDPVPTSDIDLVLVHSSTRQDERTDSFEQSQEKVLRVLQHFRGRSAVEISVVHKREEDEQRKSYPPEFRVHRTLLFGKDIYEGLFDPSVPENHLYSARRGFHRAYQCVCSFYGDAGPVNLPLSVPSPEAEFFGYDIEDVDLTGKPILGLVRMMNDCLFPVSTALINWKTGTHVMRKDTLAEFYRSRVADGWTDLVIDAFDLCRKTWHYRVPEAQADRERLRLICRRTLDFNNYFMNAYRSFVVRELSSGDRGGVLAAVGMMAQTLLNDSEVLEALKGHVDSEDDEVRSLVGSISLQRS